MSTDYRDMLRTDKDDQVRAMAFDEWVAGQPEHIRTQVDYWLFCLQDSVDQISPTTARALLGQLILFCSANVIDQDNMTRHGETVRAAYEWNELKRNMKANGFKKSEGL